MRPHFYFAYGSNCNLGQMERRCPNARVVGAATLQNYRLTFNGRDRSGGVANIRRRNGAEVKGVLWEITDACEASLDRYEGFPHLYEKKEVTVTDRYGAKYRAMAYVMTAGYRRPAMPSPWYYDGIAEGFRQNGIDTDPLEAALRETEEATGIPWYAVSGIGRKPLPTT